MTVALTPPNPPAKFRHLMWIGILSFFIGLALLIPSLFFRHKAYVVAHSRPDHYVALYSGYGFFFVSWHDDSPFRGFLPRRGWQHSPAEISASFLNWSTLPWFSFGHTRSSTNPAVYAGHLVIPAWAPILLCVWLGERFFRAALRVRNSYRFGICPHCHYDLRATPNRCPECGHTPAPSDVNP